MPALRLHYRSVRSLARGYHHGGHVQAVRLQRLASVAALALCASALQAQVIRGHVTDRVSETALAGVVVELLAGDSSGARIAATLSAVDGTYAMRVPAAGRYALTAKRIGVRRFRSEPLDVGAAQTVVRDLPLDALMFVLPPVLVTGLTSCDTQTRDGPRVASLWEEASTALYATQLSLHDQPFKAHVTRYVRELDPRSRAVLSETRSEMTGVVSRPFSSVDPDSLSALGYWSQQHDGSATYYGPDPDALLSRGFLRDHCFRQVLGRGERRHMVGVGFVPLAARTVPDVVGVLWLDARSFELRLVEFTYSRVHAQADSARVGGEVHFARLGSGAWIIRRWFLRLPVTARPSAPLTTGVTAAPWVLVRPVTIRYREEGGEVSAAELVTRPGARLPH